MIFIIIPVFNRKEFTRNCLHSVLKQTYREFTIIVVDDGSTDGTSAMITDEFPGVHLLNGDGNLWWAGATNAGIEYVFNKWKTNERDYILTLNNDLEVPEDYLQLMEKHVLGYERSIIGSVSVDIDNPERMNFCGITWNEFTGKYHLKAKDYKELYKELLLEKKEISSDMLPGRGTLIPKKVFDEIGLYDSKNFPQYAADEDFSLRARKRGWNLIIPTDVYVKSHIAETGVDVERPRFSLKQYKQLFFSIKSPLNLKVRYRWAMKNTPLKLLYFLMESTKIFLSVSLKMLKKSA